MTAGAEWKVAGHGKKCAVTGKVFTAGEAYYAALREVGDGFVRTDYALEVWASIDKTELFSFWRAKVAAGEKKRRLIMDLEAVYRFFRDLVAETPQNEAAPENAAANSRHLFVYLLALLLTRQRVLRLEVIARNENAAPLDHTENHGAAPLAAGNEEISFFDTRAQAPLRLVVPIATAPQLAAAAAELRELLA
jgi:hypothetical protein